jgi:hypothetical protein
MAVVPGYAHLLTIKILHLDKFLAPRQLLPRPCASAHLSTFCNRNNFSSTFQNCTTTLVMLNKIPTMPAKTRAIPSLHRDNFAAKEPGLCPVLASGNVYYPNRRAVRLSKNHLYLLISKRLANS